MGLLRNNSEDFFAKNVVGRADLKIKEFDPLRGRGDRVVVL